MPIHQTIVTITHPDSIPLPIGMEYVGTINRTLYTIDELSGDARDKALSHLWDLNTDYDWWEHIYEDAATIGLEITSFDLDRKNITGRLTESLRDCCALIRKHHHKECDTFKTARQYLKEYAKALETWRAYELETCPEEHEGYSPSDWLDDFDNLEEYEDIEEDFKKALLQDYFSMLRNEYDYQTSEEQVLEAVGANEYLFTEDGELAR